MRNISKSSGRHSLLWHAAVGLLDQTPQRRRKDGPHRGWFIIGVALLILSIAALVVSSMLNSNSLSFLETVLRVLTIASAVAGMLLVVWAGSDATARALNRMFRAAETAKRYLALWASTALSISIAIWLFVIVLQRGPVIDLVLVSAIQLISVGFAVSALTGPPLVAVMRDLDPVRAQAWALLVWLFSCIVGTAGAVIVASRIQNQLGAIGVVVAIAALLIATFIRSRNAVDMRRLALLLGLAALHRHLQPRPDGGAQPSPISADLFQAATDVEAALRPPRMAPLALPQQDLVDPELQATLLFALEKVTGLPYRDTLPSDHVFLEQRIAGKDLRYELAELAWELRRRLLLPASVVRFQDAHANFEHPAVIEHADAVPEHGD